MTVNKITNAPTNNVVINKINEVIDNLGTASGANTDLSNLSATGENHFQEPLVSGTNIKTINSTSILGSGDITISIPTSISDLTDDTATYPIDKANYATSSGIASKIGNSDVGSLTQPIFLDDGTPTACTYSLAKSVPSDAVFTDTTYSNFIGADSITGGVAGLVPAPSAGDEEKFLKGDGSWEIVGGGSDTSINVISDIDGALVVEVIPTPIVTEQDGDVVLDTEFPSIQEITIDQVYNPVSPNPQSGVAVALAISNKADLSDLNDLSLVVQNKADKNTITTQDITILNNNNIALVMDCSLYKHTPLSATTYVFDTTDLDISSNLAYTFELYINMSTAYTLTFPNTVSWQNNETPDFTVAGVYFFAFRTIDGGNTWLGNLQGRW